MVKITVIDYSPNSLGLVKCRIERNGGVYIRYLTEVQIETLQNKGLLGSSHREGLLSDALSAPVAEHDEAGDRIH